MRNLGQNRPGLLLRVLRDLLALVLAELLLAGLAWCLSRPGRSVLAALFRSKPASGRGRAGSAPIIDV